MIRRILVVAGIVTSFLVGWNRGFDKGYVTAMADVVLKITTPEKFFEEYFKK